MELIKKNADWFLSAEGQKVFEGCKGIEDRAVFIYSYLKTVSCESLHKEEFLFRVAFLLADAVYSSKAPYASFPALLDGAKNPFVAYVKNAKKIYDTQATYCIFLSILHEFVDPFNPSEWIYDQTLFKNGGYIEKMKEKDQCFIEERISEVADDALYDIDQELRFIQIELAWLFILSEKEGK